MKVRLRVEILHKTFREMYLLSNKKDKIREYLDKKKEHHNFIIDLLIDKHYSKTLLEILKMGYYKKGDRYLNIIMGYFLKYNNLKYQLLQNRIITRTSKNYNKIISQIYKYYAKELLDENLVVERDSIYKECVEIAIPKLMPWDIDLSFWILAKNDIKRTDKNWNKLIEICLNTPDGGFSLIYNGMLIEDDGEYFDRAVRMLIKEDHHSLYCHQMLLGKMINRDSKYFKEILATCYKNTNKNDIKRLIRNKIICQNDIEQIEDENKIKQ